MGNENQPHARLGKAEAETQITGKAKTQITGKAEMNDLSDELLHLILGKVKNLCEAAVVCKRWYNLIDQQIGRNVYIRTTSPFRANTAGAEIISEIGIHSCHVNKHFNIANANAGKIKSTNVGPPIPEPQHIVLPKLKTPNLVKSLHFHGSLPSHLFETLMVGLPNLNMLEISLDCLKDINLTSLRALTLKNLTELRISHTSPTQVVFPVEKYLHYVAVIAEIFKKKFPRLSRLNYECIIFEDDQLTSHLLAFLKRHTTTLRWLWLNFVNHAAGDGTSSIPDFDETLVEAEQLFREMKLKEICCFGKWLPESSMHVRLWTSLIKQQTTLRSFICNYKLSRITLESICVRNRSLKNLSIEESPVLRALPIPQGSVDTLSTVGCSSLSPCIFLTVVCIQANSISGTRLLPKTVKMAFFSGSMSPADCDHLLLERPQMEFLALLRPAAPAANLGVTRETLNKVITNRSFKSLVISGDWTMFRNLRRQNGQVGWGIGFPNGDPRSPITLLPERIGTRNNPTERERGVIYVALTVKLNKRGYYENIDKGIEHIYSEFYKYTLNVLDNLNVTYLNDWFSQ